MRDFDGFRITFHVGNENRGLSKCETDATSGLPTVGSVVALWRDGERATVAEVVLLVAGVVFGLAGGLFIEGCKATLTPRT